MLVWGKWGLVPFRKLQAGCLKLPGVGAASEVGLDSPVILGLEPKSPET